MVSFADLQVDTERLLLRPLREDDAVALFAIYSDPKVMRYWSRSPWTSMDEAHALIAKHMAAMAAGEYLCLGIERKGDGQLIGICTLFKFSEQCRRAEIGYGLASATWGQGYMHEALTALLNYGFSELSLNRVEADVRSEKRGLGPQPAASRLQEGRASARTLDC